MAVIVIAVLSLILFPQHTTEIVLGAVLIGAIYLALSQGIYFEWETFLPSRSNEEQL